MDSSGMPPFVCSSSVLQAMPNIWPHWFWSLYFKHQHKYPINPQEVLPCCGKIVLVASMMMTKMIHLLPVLVFSGTPLHNPVLPRKIPYV
jgi:hypothetical protein